MTRQPSCSCTCRRASAMSRAHTLPSPTRSRPAHASHAYSCCRLSVIRFPQRPHPCHDQRLRIAADLPLELRPLAGFVRSPDGRVVLARRGSLAAMDTARRQSPAAIGAAQTVNLARRLGLHTRKMRELAAGGNSVAPDVAPGPGADVGPLIFVGPISGVKPRARPHDQARPEAGREAVRSAAMRTGPIRQPGAPVPWAP
jgi:hypothetical protein